MKHAALVIALALAPLPAIAQDTAPAPDAAEEPGLMERGLALFFEGFRQEMEPALGEMGKALEEMKPAMDQLMGMIDSITNYQAPEMLENGDIIIRRKPDAPPVEPKSPDGIEL